LHHGLLAHFFHNDGVGDFAAGLCGRIFQRRRLGDDGIDFGIGRLNVAAFARLNNQGLVDQLRQDLLAEFVFADLRAFGKVLARFGNGMCQLALGNDFVVGNGGDAVGKAYGARIGRGGGAAGRGTAPESAGVAAAACFAAFCVLTGLPLDAALGAACAFNARPSAAARIRGLTFMG
jgi:hypothetical protein